MKKVLFIDRDGTLLLEPPDEQIDSFEKMEFYPGVICNLSRIRKESDYEFAIVTNQDGLGTPSFPEDTFLPVQQKMISIFENEGVIFDEIFIDSHFEKDNAPTRKPKTGMLTKYINNKQYDLCNSFVIGDRITDVQLAKNLGAKAILLGKKNVLTELSKKGLNEVCVLITTNWDDIYQFLINPPRKASITRNTKETKVEVSVNIDGTGISDISTGYGFFDHMLEQIAKHASFDIVLKTQGDMHVDEHHTIEDTALALGEAINNALGNKRGIDRYGFILPMDDCLAQVAIDLGGRSWLVWSVDFKREKIGDIPTEMFYHFFKSFSDTCKLNLNIKAEGVNEHHKIESIFKAFAKALKMATNRKSENNNSLPSTKGII